MNRDDVVAIAVDPTLTRRQAAVASREAAELLDEAGVPLTQRTWIVASGTDDVRAARVAAAIADAVGSSRLIVHDPTEPDDLTFQRRIPGQRRGGIYLNAAWQSASVRIVCGDPDLRSPMGCRPGSTDARSSRLTISTPMSCSAASRT